MRVVKISKINFSKTIAEASEIIKRGGVVVLPFDTVYGFACDSYNDQAVRKIFELKNRNLDKPIGVAVNSLAGLETIAEARNIDFIRSRIAGPFTFILPAKKSDISPLCLKEGTIAVRVPNSDIVLAIAESSGGAIAQTSANKAGQKECGSYNDFLPQFDQADLDRIDLFIDGGEIVEPKSSRIFDLTKSQPIEIDR